LGVGPEPVVTDAGEQLPVGDPGGGEEAVVAADQVVGVEDRIEVVAEVEGGPALLFVTGPQAALDLAAHRLEGGGGDDPLGGPPDPRQEVNPGVGPGRGDGSGHVTVGDEPDAGPGAPNGGDQLLVAWPVEDDHGQVSDLSLIHISEPTRPY